MRIIPEMRRPHIKIGIFLSSKKWNVSINSNWEMECIFAQFLKFKIGFYNLYSANIDELSVKCVVVTCPASHKMFEKFSTWYTSKFNSASNGLSPLVVSAVKFKLRESSKCCPFKIVIKRYHFTTLNTGLLIVSTLNFLSFLMGLALYVESLMTLKWRVENSPRVREV